jgi:hypothetical protein
MYAHLGHPWRFLADSWSVKAYWVLYLDDRAAVLDTDRRKRAAMYPGLSEADCQVATFHFRQLVDEGQRQQLSADARPASGVTRVVYASVRRQVGAFLVYAGRRLQFQGVQMVTSENLAPTPTGEMGAIA